MTDTLSDQLTALTGRQQAAAHKARTQALRQYWQIVQRHDNPRPDDAKRLRDELMPMLGKSQVDLAGDIDLVVDLAKAEARGSDAKALSEARDAVMRRYEQAREAMAGQIKAVRDNVKRLHEAANAADGRFMRARDAANRAHELRAEIEKRQS